jgi:ribosomal protein S7
MVLNDLKNNIFLMTIITQKQKFINYIMQGGKKHLARNLLDDAFTIIKERGNKDPEAIMDKAFENIMPRVEVRPKRIGGAIFQVPGDVLPKRQFFLASKWIKESAQSSQGYTICSGSCNRTHRSISGNWKCI